MTTLGWIFAVALAIAAGRLVLWTSLHLGSRYTSTLEAVRDVFGAVETYCVLPLGIGCRGNVVVRHAREGALDGLLARFRGLEPVEVVELLRSEGLRAELMPGLDSEVLPLRAPALALAARRGRIAD